NGNRVPEIVFSKMLNYSSATAKISDFKGKLIILDFWNTSCSSCIQEFPKLRALQEKYAGRIQIITVGIEIENFPFTSVSKFIDRTKNSRFKNDLPTAVAVIKKGKEAKDLLLYSLFPWQGVPHEVWIDPEGNFITSTDQKAVTERNIDAILAGNRKLLPPKKWYQPLRHCEPNFLVNPQGSHGMRFGSVFSSYNDTIGTLAGNWQIFDSQCDSNYWRFVNVNQPIYDFYFYAYRDLLPEIITDQYKRIIVDSSNAKPFYRRNQDAVELDNWSYDIFTRDNLFCYEMILPRTYSEKEVNRFLIEDFDRFFQVRSGLETRKISCLALKKIPGTIIDIRGKGRGESRTSILGDSISLHNISIDDAVQRINSLLKDRIVINETGYEGPVDLNLYN
ncbi:MAG: TlpA family protein disulfide reductase, partial [Chitinophagaceae bacterium]|nr:TlpA family protein disulfide reductase [Chitinophagaceae bacterium]